MAEDLALLESPAKYIEWKIKKFFDIPAKADYKIDSPHFVFAHIKWYLRIYPNGVTSNNSAGWIGLYLRKENSAKEHTVKCRTGIQKADGSELKAVNIEYTYKMKAGGFGNLNFFERSALVKNNVAPGGILTVFCMFLATDGQVASPTIETATQTQSLDGITTLSENFKDLYLKQRFTDVTIRVKSREFVAHRIVLASRSSVFTAMFDHDMAEKKSGSVEIADCNPDAFEQFLLFLYTGKFDVVLSSNAVELYMIADRYDVQQLKEACARCMARDLTIYSFCDVFHLAALQNESDLLKSATEFFINNADNILSTQKWNDFLEDYPAAGNNLFKKFLEFIKNK